jgi:hypothetical protein
MGLGMRSPSILINLCANYSFVRVGLPDLGQIHHTIICNHNNVPGYWYYRYCLCNQLMATFSLRWALHASWPFALAPLPPAMTSTSSAQWVRGKFFCRIKFFCWFICMPVSDMMGIRLHNPSWLTICTVWNLHVTIIILRVCVCVCVYQVMDESKLLSHQTKLERWQERQKEKKHLFTITQDNLSGSDGGSSQATPSRGGKVGTPQLHVGPFSAFHISQGGGGRGEGRT